MQHTWDSDDGLGEKGTKDDGESDSSDELTSSEPGALHETALLESSLAASKDNSAVDLKAAVRVACIHLRLHPYTCSFWPGLALHTEDGANVCA